MLHKLLMIQCGETMFENEFKFPEDQDLIHELMLLGVVKKDYKTNEFTVSILKEINDDEVITPDDLEIYVNEFRNKFANYPHLKGNKGSKAKIYERLQWFINETDLTIEEIDQATDKYIQECVQQNRYLLDPHYFIWKSETYRTRNLVDSKLWSIYEDMTEDTYSGTSYDI